MEPRALSSRLVLGVIILVAMLIGLNYTVLKFALEHTTPLLLAGMRTAIGSTALISLAILRGERFPRRAGDLANILAVSNPIGNRPCRYLLPDLTCASSRPAVRRFFSCSKARSTASIVVSVAV